MCKGFPHKPAPTAAAAFFQQRRAEFDADAANRALSAMRKGARCAWNFEAAGRLGRSAAASRLRRSGVLHHRQRARRAGRRRAVSRSAGANVEVRAMTEKTKLELVTPTPNDALDIEALWLDSALGDGLTDTSWQTIPVDKPKDFFRVHPDPDFRRRTEIYVHKIEGQIETSYYILGPKMRGRLQEARPCVLVTCIYRDGSPRLWPIMFPRDGEKDNTAWSSCPVRGAHRDRQMGAPGLE